MMFGNSLTQVYPTSALCDRQFIPTDNGSLDNFDTGTKRHRSKSLCHDRFLEHQTFIYTESSEQAPLLNVI